MKEIELSPQQTRDVLEMLYSSLTPFRIKDPLAQLVCEEVLLLDEAELKAFKREAAAEKKS